MTSKMLLEEMLSSSEYKKYIEIYKNKKYIDKYLLEILLNKYLDLYYLFLKVNILLYRYDNKHLRNELQDYTHYNGNMLYLDDIDIIMKYYYNNYSKCKSELRKIIEYKLRPNSELKIIDKILNRDITKEIIPIYNN